jgi:hypothetical protein
MTSKYLFFIDKKVQQINLVATRDCRNLAAFLKLAQKLISFMQCALSKNLPLEKTNPESKT